MTVEASELLVGLKEFTQGWQATLHRRIGSQAAADPLGQFTRALVACIALIEQYNSAVVSNVANTPPYCLIDRAIGLQCVPADIAINGAAIFRIEVITCCRRASRDFACVAC